MRDTEGLFFVIFSLKMYNDVLYDATAEIEGIAELAESLMTREKHTTFLAIQWPVPMAEGQYLANPSGLQKTYSPSITNLHTQPGGVNSHLIIKRI